MPDPERPEPGGYDPVGPRPKEAVSPTGQGGPMDLALDEAESVEGIEKTTGPVGPAPAERARSLWSDAWHQLRRNPVFVLSSLLILFLVVISIWPQLIASGDPLQCDLSKSQEGAEPGHPFGFDRQGCDVYTRTVYGARAPSPSASAPPSAPPCSAPPSAGSPASSAAGATRCSPRGRHLLRHPGGPRRPGLPVRRHQHHRLAGGRFIVLLGWPQIARIARGSVITAKQNDYVQAARALGAGNGRMLLRHVAPNAVAPVIVVATIALGTYIALEATLSFLGVGLRPPTVSWGIDISNAAPQIRNAPHMLLWPAGALSLTVLAFIMLGDAVRDALDPKLR